MFDLFLVTSGGRDRVSNDICSSEFLDSETRCSTTGRAGALDAPCVGGVADRYIYIGARLLRRLVFVLTALFIDHWSQRPGVPPRGRVPNNVWS